LGLRAGFGVTRANGGEWFYRIGDLWRRGDVLFARKHWQSFANAGTISDTYSDGWANDNSGAVCDSGADSCAEHNADDGHK